MEITEIKTKLSILKVLNHYSIQPDKNNQIKCPFHDDKTPSMRIYPETNTYHCFGCGKTGDQIQFIQDCEKITKHQAILKAEALINETPANQEKYKPNNQKPMKNIELLKMFTSFKLAIQRSPKAREYTEKRHLNINKPEIGYNSGATYKKMKNCLIFPLKNKENQIVSFYGRSILNNNQSSIKNNQSGRHYYTTGRTGLYPEYPKEETQTLILTESIIDAATLLQFKTEAGILSEVEILACYGTNGLKEEHTEAIQQLPELQEIIFFFDGDKTGRDAVNKYSESLKNILKNDCKISTAETPDNEDINSLLDGHDQEIFTHLLDKRKQLFLSIEKPLIEPEEPKQNKQINISPNHQTNTLNTANADYITLTTDDLQMTVLGGINLQQLDRLRITLKITCRTGNVRNNIDLYNIDQTDRFINKASEKLEIGSSTLNRAISELTDKLENYRMSKIEAMKTRKPKDRILTASREQAAINYLKNKDLLKRTNEDIGKTGVIGEENNRLLMYLIFTSRLREQPLHIISLGGSGTGKTYLQEKISELIPENDKKIITILSENAFYYFEKKEITHKLILIEDMDGAEAVLYPLRELMSKRIISKTVTIKDSKGNNKTVSLTVEGPICLAGTTTKERLYEDNANRAILIYLDNTKEHKEKIMNYQRKLSAGKIDTKKEEEIKELFKDIQTVLRPVKVRNLYAEQLKIPEHVFKPLRTNSHYLAFIETITFYHQYQRTLKTDTGTGSPACEPYIETTIEDIEEANKLIKDVLLAKSDELSKALRNFFETIKYHVKASGNESFFTKEIREKLRLNPMTVNRYMRDLESRSFIKRVGGNRKKGFEYEVSNWKEYNDLQRNTEILNDILEQIKNGTPKPRQD